ncbi:MAG: transglycosylase SLT domain-containing protein [Proteobacteria bacterium]|nr:transglycosylase SLT domain-containing protein [Pseudomonadota bacterium]
MKPPYSNCYDHYFQKYSLEFFGARLQWSWTKAIAITESELNPAAVSKFGALGVMQLMPGTAAEMAAKHGGDDTILAPHINIRLGIAFARQCFDIWQEERGLERIRFMLGSYNAGPGNILKAQQLAAKHSLPTDRWQSIAATLPEVTGKKSAETINYVKKVERAFEQLSAKEIKQ